MHANSDDEPFDRRPWRELLARDASEPPPATDARIRAAARRTARGAGRRWILPASLAASALLAVLLMQQEQEHRPEQPPATRGAEVAAATREPAARAAPLAPPAAQASRADVAVTAAAPPATPEEWYARIEELRAAGRTTEAETELAALERAHPGWLARRAAAPH
ncbi:MAG: hypothetical protein FJ191_02505 [Gammaproteobacteria bacterium]|nr:hypothetical protein [Gammaproteobacteria bacterium]